MKKIQISILIAATLMLSGDFFQVEFGNSVQAKNFLSSQNKVLDDCSWNGISLHGKIKFVESFPDIKIQVVESFPDLKVKLVSSFPDHCGEWKVVESFPDIKVQIVESFPDLKVQFVESLPGLP